MMLLVLGEHTLGRRAGGSGESWGLSQKSRGLLQPPVQKWAPSLKMVAPRGLSVCTARVEDLFCTYWRMFKLTPCHPNSRRSMGLPQSLLVWKVVPPQARVSHGAPRFLSCQANTSHSGHLPWGKASCALSISSDITGWGGPPSSEDPAHPWALPSAERTKANTAS